MSEWPMVKLGKLGKWTAGGTPSRRKHEYFNGEIPWASIADLNDGPIIKTAESITELGLDNSSTKIYPVGSILIAMYGSIGKLGINTVPMASSQAIACFIPNKEIERDYAFWSLYALRSKLISIGRGGTQKNIGQGLLKDIEIPLPPLGEQKRIAEILGNIQNAIELTSLQLDDISSSMKIESWTLTRDSPQTQLSHYIKKITSGKSLKEGNWENFQNCILKISAVTTGFFDDSEIKPLPESYTPQASHKVNTGDILLSRANTTELVGASAIVENAANNLYLPDKLWKLHIKDDVDTYFFWHLLQTKPVRSSISKASSGSGGSMKNISQKSFLNITVPKISREVQNQIGKNIRLQHILRSLLIKKLNLLQELQRSLSVRAFAGEL